MEKPARKSSRDKEVLDILVVESDKSRRKKIIKALKGRGLNPDFADSNVAGIRKLETSHSYQVVICSQDYEIPIHFLWEVQENDSISRPTIIVAGSHMDNSEGMALLNAGFDGVLSIDEIGEDLAETIHQAHSESLHPANPERMFIQAKQKLVERKFFDAEKLFKRLVAETNSPRPFVGLAKASLLRKEFNKVILLLERASDKQPNYPMIHDLKAKAYFGLNRQDDALREVRSLVENDADNPFGYRMAATILIHRKLYSEALELLQACLEKKLNFFELNLYLGKTFQALNDHQNAANYLKLAHIQDPQDIVIMNILAVTYRQLGDLDSAIKIYDKVIELDDNSKIARYNKSTILAMQGNKEEALVILNEIYKEQHNFPGVEQLIKQLKAKIPLAS